MNETNQTALFSQFGLSDAVLKGVSEAGFTVPSPIQVESIPMILDGKDILAQAHTGTGKTAAFGLPIMSKMQAGEQMLILTPTRELAMQISDELFRLGKFTGLKTAAICGGQSYTRQKSSIASGAQIISATPGRLLDLLSNSKVSFKPKYVVLDEADEMLDMGFFDDIKAIFEFLPKERQTLLFSATLPKMVEKLASSFMKDPQRINTKGTRPETKTDISELYFVVEEYERDNALVRLVDYYDPVKAIIFTRTKKDADRVSTYLVAKGYPAKCLHGDLSQPQREDVIKSFRKGEITFLAATDVAARGLDIADVSHVFNYHMPFAADSYVHRIGRTGRAGNKGIAITIVTPQEYRGLARIQRTTGSNITYRQVPTLSETHENLISSLVQKIRGTNPSQFANSIIKALEQDMDIHEVAMHLASVVWNNEGLTGPENLGVQGKKLEQLHSNGGSDDRRSGGDGRRDGDRGGKKRYGGGSGSGSSSNSSWYNRRQSYKSAPRKDGKPKPHK